jgi:MATE family multidrug resistance protein
MGHQPVEPAPSPDQASTTNNEPTAHATHDTGIPAGPYTEPAGATEAAGEAGILAATTKSTPGGSRELLKLALPLVVSQSFMTVQVFVDTLLLSWHDPLEMAASFPSVMWY